VEEAVKPDLEVSHSPQYYKRLADAMKQYSVVVDALASW
jgi:hypothetical protein